MKAYVLERYGGPEGSRLMDVPAPTPRPGDILVEVRAAGLNPVDFKFRQGKLRAILRPKLPFVLATNSRAKLLRLAATSNGSASVIVCLP
jgi:NADPH:quinone reductase-like Zn-dependent oxidoreductase